MAIINYLLFLPPHFLFRVRFLVLRLGVTSSSSESDREIIADGFSSSLIEVGLEFLVVFLCFRGLGLGAGDILSLQ